jgi:DNA polymerase elongation subunit (family B)
MNSLYGRFAMQDVIYKTVIVSDILANEIFSVYPIINIIELGDILMITYIDEVDKNICHQSNADYLAYKLYKDHSGFNNISIAISCAVAAYGRIIMNKFKTIQNNPCIYTDTDSIVLQKPLDPKWVHKTKLGLFKLEYEIKRGVFINPKTYYIETFDGEVIIKIKGLKNSNSMTFQDFIYLWVFQSIRLILNGLNLMGKVLYT